MMEANLIENQCKDAKRNTSEPRKPRIVFLDTILEIRLKPRPSLLIRLVNGKGYGTSESTFPSSTRASTGAKNCWSRRPSTTRPWYVFHSTFSHSISSMVRVGSSFFRGHLANYQGICINDTCTWNSIPNALHLQRC